MKNLSNKNILVISPESWGTSFLSKHLYALELLKHGNKVWFLNSPGYKKDEKAKRDEIIHPGLFIIDDTVFKGLLQLPKSVQRVILKKKIRRLGATHGVKWDIIWSFDNSRYFLLDCFKEAFRIHHVVDEHMDYMLASCCATADLCLGVSPSIVKKISGYNLHSHFIDHGYASFSSGEIKLKQTNKKWNAVYIGNLLLPSFNRKFLLFLTEKFSDVQFHLVGSYSKGNLNESGAVDDQDIGVLKQKDNVTFYGEVPYDDAFSLASQADVLMLLYFDKDKKIAENSSKIMPYLATGKAVVSNYFSLYEGKDVLRMAKNQAEYANLFEDTLKHLDQWNDENLAGKRMAYAKSNSYCHHLEIIDKLMEGPSK